MPIFAIIYCDFAGIRSDQAEAQQHDLSLTSMYVTTAEIVAGFAAKL